MTEPTYGDFIAYIHAIVMSLALALIAAGVLTRFEFAAACRRTAEGMESGYVRSNVLKFAESIEAAGVDGEPAPLWTPEVIPGGKGEDDRTV